MRSCSRCFGESRRSTGSTLTGVSPTGLPAKRRSARCSRSSTRSASWTTEAILIDDARLFLALPPEPHDVPDWPRFREILERLFSLGASHELTVVADVIAFYPKRAHRAVSAYAQARDMQLLVQTDRLAGLEREYATHASAATDRLRTIEQLTSELELQAEAADERLAEIERLRQELDVQTAAAEERLAVIEELTRERDLQARAAEERLARLEELNSTLDTTVAELTEERDVQTRAAEERLAAIDELRRDRDLHAKVAEERLERIEQLTADQLMHSRPSTPGWR